MATILFSLFFVKSLQNIIGDVYEIRKSGALLGILIDGCKMPNKSLRISIDGWKLTFDCCFEQKSMGAVRTFSKLVD